MTISDKVIKIAENEAKIFEKGKQAEYDAFWDGIQNYGNRTEYSSAFRYWGAEYVRPKYKVVPTTHVYNMFYGNSNLKKVEAKYFDLSQVEWGSNETRSHAYLLATCRNLDEIEDIGLAPNRSYSYFAAWSTALKKVACIRLSADTAVNQMLYGLPNLDDVVIEGEIGKSGIDLWQSTKLKHDTIVNFIDVLSNNTSGLSITFSKTAVNKAFETSSGAADGSTSTEWQALIATKPNWTISLK